MLNNYYSCVERNLVKIANYFDLVDGDIPTFVASSIKRYWQREHVLFLRHIVHFLRLYTFYPLLQLKAQTFGWVLLAVRVPLQ